MEGCGLGEGKAAFVLVVDGPGRCGIGCGCRGREGRCCAGVETRRDGGVEAGLQPGGRCC